MASRVVRQLLEGEMHVFRTRITPEACVTRIQALMAGGQVESSQGHVVGSVTPFQFMLQLRQLTSRSISNCPAAFGYFRPTPLGTEIYLRLALPQIAQARYLVFVCGGLIGLFYVLRMYLSKEIPFANAPVQYVFLSSSLALVIVGILQICRGIAAGRDPTLLTMLVEALEAEEVETDR